MDDALTNSGHPGHPGHPGHRVEVVADARSLARRAAEVVSDLLREAIARHGRALFALAGGSTPRATYTELAKAELRWDAVDFVWGDERMVPPEDPASNVRMARETLLTPLDIDGSRIHAPRTDLDLEQAASEYEDALRALDPRHHPPRLDVVLLGLGPDGHTASLFPGGAELDPPTSRLVTSSTAAVAPRHRITFTLRMLTAAHHVVFLVSGADKRAALARVLAGDLELPAARAVPVDGSVLWIVDRAARGGEG